MIAGIAAGCKQAGCALVGGETAEMPGMYSRGRLRSGRFRRGRGRAQQGYDGTRIEAGDIVLGLASSGVHSNGFSLVRKIVADEKLKWDEPAPFDSKRKLAEALLEPTRIYVTPGAESGA